jgi:hypothetical protein
MIDIRNLTGFSQHLIRDIVSKAILRSFRSDVHFNMTFPDVVREHKHVSCTRERISCSADARHISTTMSERIKYSTVSMQFAH